MRHAQRTHLDFRLRYYSIGFSKNQVLFLFSREIILHWASSLDCPMGIWYNLLKSYRKVCTSRRDTPMLTPNNKKAHLLYGCAVSVIVVVLGIVLILSALDIYQADPTGAPYSPATISAHFHNISILVYCALVLIAGGVLLDVFAPVKAERPKPIRDQRAIMRKAAAKSGMPSVEEQKRIDKERLIRTCITAGCVGLFTGLMVYPLIYVIFFHDYAAANPNAEVIKSTLIVFIPAIVGFALWHVGAILVSKSYQRQTDLYKSIKNTEQKPDIVEKTASKVPVCILRCSILAIAVIFIVMGILNGSAYDVLTKAVAICTECIGLG